MSAATPVSDGPISVGRRSHHPLLAVAAVLLGAYMTNFHSRIFSTGLADLRGAFGLGMDEGAWLSSIAQAPQILIAPCVAWLVTVFGVRRVLVVPAFLYGALCLVTPFIRDVGGLMLIHAVEGLLLGLFVPATLTVILRNLPMKWWVPAVAVYVFRQAFAINSGIDLVGLYTQDWGWQWLYWQDVVLAPLMGLCAWAGAPREPVDPDLLHRADWGGMLLFGSGLAMLYIALDQGNRLDWLESGLVTAFLAGGILLLVLFAINEWLVEQPWASARVLLSRNLGLTLLVSLLYTFASVSNSALIPNFLSTVGHLRPEQVGPLLLQWGALPLLVLMPFCVWLLGRVDARALVVVGLSAFGLAALMGTGVTHDWRLDDFRLMLLLQAVGHCFTFLPIVVLALANTNPARATTVSAYIQVLRVDGVVLASALATTGLRLSEQLHSNLIGLHLPQGDKAVADAVGALGHAMAGHGQAAAQAFGLSNLASLVQREATVLSYIDGFWACFALALAGILTIALTTRPPAGPFTPGR